MKTYRVYEAYENAVGGIELRLTGREECVAESAEVAARYMARVFGFLGPDWDGGDVIVATDDDGDSFHLYRKNEAVEE